MYENVGITCVGQAARVVTIVLEFSGDASVIF